MDTDQSPAADLVAHPPHAGSGAPSVSRAVAHDREAGPATTNWCAAPDQEVRAAHQQVCDLVCAPGCAESVRSIGTVASMNKKPRAPLVVPAMRGEPSTPRGLRSPASATNLHELGDIKGPHPDLRERHVPQPSGLQDSRTGGRHGVHRQVHAHVTVHDMDTIARTTPSAPPGQPAGLRGFASPEGLRQLLYRLHDAGPDAWATDPEAEALLEYCAHRFGALARRYRQTPHDAAVASFEVLRAAATARAVDPWAVVTRAVELTLQADERADALLCSTGKARRLMTGGHHDVVRFGERDDGDRSWTDHLEAAAAVGRRPPDDSSTHPSSVHGVAPGEVPLAVANIVELLVALGWPRTIAANGLDYICSRLTEAGNSTTAFEYLRRDLTPLTLLDIPHRCWTALCRIVLGPDDGPGRVTGLLRRALSGEPVSSLLTDQRLVSQIARSSPPGHRTTDPATGPQITPRTVRDA